MERVLRRVLDLPGGLHFRKVKLSRCGGEGFHRVARLVVACSDTLRNLEIKLDLFGGALVSSSDWVFIRSPISRRRYTSKTPVSSYVLEERDLNSLQSYAPSNEG